MAISLGILTQHFQLPTHFSNPHALAARRFCRWLSSSAELPATDTSQDLWRRGHLSAAAWYWGDSDSAVVDFFHFFSRVPGNKQAVFNKPQRPNERCLDSTLRLDLTFSGDSYERNTNSCLALEFRQCTRGSCLSGNFPCV